MQGWVKMYRDILENPIVCKDSEYFAIWSYLLLQAVHADKDAVFAGERITLKPGQLITGRKQIAKHFKISESKVQRVLKVFEEENQITQTSSNKNRLISILNWAQFQEVPKEKQQQAPPPPLPEQQEPSLHEEEIPIVLSEEVKQIAAAEAAAPEAVKVLSHKEIIEKWNSLGLGQIKKLTSQRLTSTKARIGENSIEEFFKAIELIKESTFLQGQNPRGWVITYDWFVKPNNFLKVLEGNYTDKSIPKLSAAATGLPAKVQQQLKMETHGTLLDDIDELEAKYQAAMIAEMNKAKAQ